MVTQDLLDFIKKEQAVGSAKEQINQKLLEHGWKQEDITAAFTQLENGNPVPWPAGAQLPSATELLKEAYGIYNRHFWKFVGTYFVSVLVVFIATLLFAGGTALGVAGFGGLAKLSPGPHYHFTPLVAAGFFIMLVVVVLASMWGQAALLVAIRDSEQNLKIKEIYQKAWPKVGALFVTSLLSGLAVAGGFILLIIPGIIFAVWLAFTSYIVIEENLSGTAALSKSKSYVSGRWSAVAWRLAVIVLLVMVISGLTGAASKFLGSGTVRQRGDSLLSFIVQGIITPYFVVYGYLLYKKLKA